MCPVATATREVSNMSKRLPLIFVISELLKYSFAVGTSPATMKDKPRARMPLDSLTLDSLDCLHWFLLTNGKKQTCTRQIQNLVAQALSIPGCGKGTHGLCALAARECKNENLASGASP